MRRRPQHRLLAAFTYAMLQCAVVLLRGAKPTGNIEAGEVGGYGSAADNGLLNDKDGGDDQLGGHLLMAVVANNIDDDDEC